MTKEILLQNLEVKIKNGEINRDYLIKNKEIALFLAENSLIFEKSDLAQDFTILTIKDVAAKLSLKHHWPTTPAAENLEIISIQNSSGSTIGHMLASHPLWAASNAAQNSLVLKLTEHNGVSVAHSLASRSNQWVMSDAAQKFEILSLKDSSGRSVAHYCLQTEPGWVKTPAASNIDVLNITDTRGYSVAHAAANYSDWFSSTASMNKHVLCKADDNNITVMQVMLNTIQKNQQSKRNLNCGKILIRLIDSGAAFNPIYRKKPFKNIYFTIDDINELKEYKDHDVKDECSIILKAKKQVALYATLMNFLQFDSYIEDIFYELVDFVTSIEIEIEEMFNCHQHLFGDKHHFNDYNLDFGMDLIARLEAKKNIMSFEIDIPDCEVKVQNTIY
jgi:hypothetical protein